MAVEGERPLSEFYEEEFEAEKVRTSILAESAERLSRFSSEVSARVAPDPRTALVNLRRGVHPLSLWRGVHPLSLRRGVHPLSLLALLTSQDIKIEDAVKARTRHDQHAAYEEVLGNLKAAGISPADLVEYYAFNYAEEETRTSVLLDEPTTRASEGVPTAAVGISAQSHLSVRRRNSMC